VYKRQDCSGTPVEEATVAGSWQRPGGGTETTWDTTDGSGTAVSTSSWVRKSLGGQFVYDVDDVMKTGWVLDRTRSVLSACINADRSSCN